MRCMSDCYRFVTTVKIETFLNLAGKKEQCQEIKVIRVLTAKDERASIKLNEIFLPSFTRVNNAMKNFIAIFDVKFRREKDWNVADSQKIKLRRKLWRVKYEEFSMSNHKIFMLRFQIIFRVQKQKLSREIF